MLRGQVTDAVAERYRLWGRGQRSVNADRIRATTSTPVRTPAMARLRSGPAPAVAAVYMVAGTGWIVVREWVLSEFVPGAQERDAQIDKSLGFLAITSITPAYVLAVRV